MSWVKTPNPRWKTQKFRVAFRMSSFPKDYDKKTMPKWSWAEATLRPAYDAINARGWSFAVVYDATGARPRPFAIAIINKNEKVIARSQRLNVYDSVRELLVEYERQIEKRAV